MLRLLARSFQENSVLAHNYCLMTNHLHILAQVGDVPLGDAMHGPLFRYGQYFNALNQRTGHVFEDRFKSILCEDNAQLFATVRYIERNPVQAGMVDDASLYPWSSYGAYLGRPDPLVTTDFVLSLFQGSRDPRLAFASFIGARAESKWPHPSVRECVQMPVVRPPLPELSRVDLPPAALLALAGETAAVAGCGLGALAGPSKERYLMRVRRSFVRQAVLRGFPLTQIAGVLGRSPSTVSALASGGGRNKPEESEARGLSPIPSAGTP